MNGAGRYENVFITAKNRPSQLHFNSLHSGRWLFVCRKPEEVLWFPMNRHNVLKRNVDNAQKADDVAEMVATNKLSTKFVN